MRKPIQTAAARHAGGIVIPVELTPGELVEFRFAPAVGVAMLAAVDRMQSVTGTDAARSIQQVQIMADYLVSIVHESQRDLFRARVDDDTLDVQTLVAIFQAVREDADGMDPTRQGSSSDGSSTTGTDSTDGAPPEA